MKPATGSCVKVTDIEGQFSLDILIFEKDENVATIILTRQAFKAYSNLILVPKIHPCKVLLIIVLGGRPSCGQHGTLSFPFL